MKAKRLVTDGKIWLKWSDGNTVELGTVKCEPGNTAYVMTSKRFWLKFGWGLVWIGFYFMLPGRKWRMRCNDQG